MLQLDGFQHPTLHVSTPARAPRRLLTPADFHAYQRRAIEHVVEHPRSMLWLDMSLGKTIIVLTAIQELIAQLSVYRVLVLGPRRVVETVWEKETQQWSHTTGMRTVLLRGTDAGRMAPEARLRALHRRDCEIHLCNYESIPWLVRAVNDQFLSRGKYLPWNMVVFDEVDRFKDSMGKRYRTFEPLLPYFTRRVGMTGTPGDNGYLDLHGQFKMVDDGERLYPHIGTFRQQWFKAGYAEQSWTLARGAKEQIERRIGDITLSMSAEDYLKLPDFQFHDIWVKLDKKTQAQYDSLERELFAQLDHHPEDDAVSENGTWDLAVFNQLSARTKCRQLANGAIINPDGSGRVMLVHDYKLEALDSIVHEAAGKPILLSYMYRHDMERIKARYERQGYRIGYIGPGTKDINNVLAQWDAKQYHILITHALSAGHGLNMQLGGNIIVWFGLTDALRLYRQLNARLRRQGQTEANVHVYRILARNTIDEPMDESLESKTATAQELRAAIERYRLTKGAA